MERERVRARVVWYQERRRPGRVIECLTLVGRFSVDFRVGATTIQSGEVPNGEIQ